MPINTNKTSFYNFDSSKENITLRTTFELVDPKYQLSDLVLPQATMADIKKALSLQKFQNEIFETWGLKETHKYDNKLIINFYGESGTGKTMSAHALAYQLGKRLLIVNYADIESKYVGETPKNIKAAFDFAKKNDAILFFDEADAILSRRVTNMTNATDTSVNQTRSVLLNILNDYNDVVLFSTNFISNYDPAFMRRILIHIKFSLPNKVLREALFRRYIPKRLPHNISLQKISEISEGLTGSDISNSILLAAFSVKADQRNFVEHEDLVKEIIAIKQSKLANLGKDNIIKIEERNVSESFVNQQLFNQ